MSPTLLEFLLWFPGIVIALALHEFGHAVVADRLGDPTPRALGRVTLNPLAHLDPMGTLLIVFLHFGWGRPVPVDTRYLARPRRDMLLIAAAGPAMNLLTALVVGLGLRQGGEAVLGLSLSFGPFLYAALQALVLLSLLLSFFNLIPLPPLDGSKVLTSLLPATVAAAYLRHGYLLSWGLIGLVVVGSLTGTHLLAGVIYPPSRWLYALLVGVDP